MKSPRRSLAVTIAAVAATTTLAACGGATNAAGPASATTASTSTSSPPAAAPSSSAPSSSAPPTASAVPASAAGDACALVTEQEVATAIGSDPGPGSPFSSHGSTQCQYGSMAKAFVLVNLTPSQGTAAFDLMHDNPNTSQAGTVSPVAGLGDRAFGVFSHGTAGIYVNKGDALLLVMVTMRTAAVPPKSQALALATSAVGRLS